MYNILLCGKVDNSFIDQIRDTFKKNSSLYISSDTSKSSGGKNDIDLLSLVFYTTDTKWREYEKSVINLLKYKSKPEDDIHGIIYLLDVCDSSSYDHLLTVSKQLVNLPLIVCGSTSNCIYNIDEIQMKHDGYYDISEQSSNVIRKIFLDLIRKLQKRQEIEFIPHEIYMSKL